MCRHVVTGLTTEKDANHKWSGDPGRSFLWVVCPKTFQAHVGTRKDDLGRWAAAGFPNGWVYAIDNLWIVSPDPGCEL